MSLCYKVTCTGTILNAKINAFLSSQHFKSAIAELKDFIEILSAEFQQGLFFNYFLTVDLVMLPKITALLVGLYK